MWLFINLSVTQFVFFWCTDMFQNLFCSVCNEQKVNALASSFVHSPVGGNADWRLSATISPCHVTVIS
jgi:hypothetical protein